MIDKTFTDLQGNKLSLRQMVFAEPQWAFNRIKELEASTNHESLEAVRAEFTRLIRMVDFERIDNQEFYKEAEYILGMAIDKAKGVRGD